MTHARERAEPIAGGSGRRRADRDGRLARALLLPSMIYLVVLVGVPLALAVALAFSDVTAGDPSYDFAGLRNFTAVFRDGVFWRSLANTLMFTVASTALVVVLGKIVANILVADFRGRWAVRFLVLLPWTTPAALSAISWLWMLDAAYSPIERLLRDAGVLDPNADWLRRPGLTMGSVVAVHVWRLTPLAAVIMMAGLAAVPKDLDEAARIDGAGFWRRMFEVTIPLAMPAIAVAGVLTAVITGTDLTVVYVLARGEPADSTQVLASLAYLRGVEAGDVGQGAAIALLLFPLPLAAALAVLRGGRRGEGP